ncbi:MAG: formimidoylglutamase [Bdellovibrionales bacterium]|nr:formimidoylglutamase [Bdellovibrionales bacterium]
MLCVKKSYCQFHTKYYVTKHMTPFIPYERKLYNSVLDDPRLGDSIIPLSPSNLTTQTGKTWYLLGYPDDEGIKMNGGRTGASLAPDAIRSYLYRMTPHWLALDKINIFDLGNLPPNNLTLTQRHQIARETVQNVMEKGGKVISFGGGHDYGYADASAFLKTFSHSKPLLINLDAHLDVRPTDNGFNSGTPFRRILNEFQNFDFLEIGLQPQCNSKIYREWTLAKGAHLLGLEEIRAKGPNGTEILSQFISPFIKKPRPLFLSIDLDVFTSSEAPGCSQSWPSGLTHAEIFTLINNLINSCQLKGVGFYEVSPPLDVDGRTSRLAALLAHQIIFGRNLDASS